MSKKKSQQPTTRYRTRPEDVTAAVHVINDNKADVATGTELYLTNMEQLGKQVEKQVKVFTMFGDHDVLDEEGNPVLLNFEEDDIIAEEAMDAFAKIVVVDNGSPAYYVKGSKQGCMFNPNGMYTEGLQNKSRFRAAGNEWDWLKVNKKVFAFYVDFLRTKNISHLRNAERENF